ncbi:MAG: B12-binding domain-containing radical SAM protein [bacterium]
MMKEKILLLNPPANSVCIRDYFCSKTSRSDYLFPPIDLLILSGRLSQNYSIELMDAIVEKIQFHTALDKISKMDLKAIICLVGAVNWESDITFVRRIKEVTSAKIICIGDCLLEKAKDLMSEYNYVDATLLDFSSADLLHYLNGDLNQIKNMVLRIDNVLIEKEIKRYRGHSFELPIPRHELFQGKNYRLPFVRGKSFTVVLTDFGCPFNCAFCVMPSLGYKYRQVDNIIEELEYIHTLGIEEIFFADQSFGALKERNIHLCTQIIKRKLNFRWICFSRADLLDRKSLELMKQAGCHTIIIGVESADPAILKMYKKYEDINYIKSVFELCRTMKISTVGTFIIGFPEDTRESCLKTINFAKELNCDFASFHVAVPRAGTGLRKKAVQMDLIDWDLRSMDQSGSIITMPSQKLSKEELLQLRRKAVKEFYLRPRYLLNRIIAIKSFKEIVEQMREGWYLLKDNI